jgi:disulfide bond formation protein DsbB
METETLTRFLALVELGGLAGLITALAIPSLRARIVESALSLAAIVAIGATLGSLAFSEIADFVPCDFCWYQRIAMYPLAVILAIAAIRGDTWIRPYALALAGIGLSLAAYHVQLQWFPEQSSTCEVTNPCSGRWVEAFGWLTIPQMSAIAFILIIGLLSLGALTNLDAPHPEEQQ